MRRPKCYIFIGIPCSGKSTEAEKMGIRTISCDEIRKEFSPQGKLVYDPKIEEIVWKTFYERLKEFRWEFIVDNTNCKEKYIKQIIANVHPSFDFEYIVFEIPLWKAKLRNIWRWITTGKYIPISVMNSMHRNFENIKHLYKQNG